LSKNQNDLILARETQLLFNYTQGFQPVEGGLNKWQGEIAVQTPQGSRKVPVEIFIPLKFPQYPPRVMVLEDVSHPNVKRDGSVLLRITHEWKPDTHVYQVIQALKDLFEKVPPKFIAPAKDKTRTKASVQPRETFGTKDQKQVETIEETITDLQRKIKQKEEELRRLRAEVVKGSDETLTTIDNIEMLMPKDKQTSEQLHLQAQRVALADLLSTLDAKFQDGEINPVDFAKLYRRYSKELYIVSKKLEK
jgi:ubiquitin-protein ligase